MRLRLMGMPFSSVRYATNRSSVQDAKGRPRLRGLVKAAAITSPTCSRLYVGGQPERGASRSPASPAALNRVSQVRTVRSFKRRSAAMAGRASPGSPAR